MEFGTCKQNASQKLACRGFAFCCGFARGTLSGPIHYPHFLSRLFSARQDFSMPDSTSTAAAAFRFKVVNVFAIDGSRLCAVAMPPYKRKSSGSDRGKASKAKVNRAPIPQSVQRCVDEIVGWLLGRVPSSACFQVHFPSPYRVTPQIRVCRVSDNQICTFLCRFLFPALMAAFDFVCPTLKIDRWQVL